MGTENGVIENRDAGTQLCVAGIASHIEHGLDWLVKPELEPRISGSTWPLQYCLALSSPAAFSAAPYSAM